MRRTSVRMSKRRMRRMSMRENKIENGRKGTGASRPPHTNSVSRKDIEKRSDGDEEKEAGN